jgi:BolA protein
MSAERIERIRARLERAFTPQRLEVVDDSAAHRGHAGAERGGHFRVEIVAEAFRGQAARDRHRAVYVALGDLLETDVHAVNIRALAPGEGLEGPRSAGSSP